MDFSAEIRRTGANTTGIEVPDDVVVALGGGKRPKVAVTINGYRYRSSIATMGGVFMVSVSAEVRDRAGVAGGDHVGVEIVLDTEERTVEIPEDLAIALTSAAGARERFERLSYSNRRRHVLAVDGAKGADTRRRRIEKVLSSLDDNVV